MVEGYRPQPSDRTIRRTKASDSAHETREVKAMIAAAITQRITDATEPNCVIEVRRRNLLGMIRTARTDGWLVRYFSPRGGGSLERDPTYMALGTDGYLYRYGKVDAHRRAYVVSEGTKEPRWRDGRPSSFLTLEGLRAVLHETDRGTLPW